MLFTYLHLPQWFWGQTYWSYPHAPVGINNHNDDDDDLNDDDDKYDDNLPDINENNVQTLLCK